MVSEAGRRGQKAYPAAILQTPAPFTFNLAEVEETLRAIPSSFKEDNECQ